jgi:hypothetical protein
MNAANYPPVNGKRSRQAAHIRAVITILPFCAVFWVQSCTGHPGRELRLSELAECVVTTSDRIADHKEGSNSAPVWAYARSTLITQKIRILRTEQAGGLVVLSSAVDKIHPGDRITHLYGIATNSFAKYFDLLELNVNRDAKFTVRRRDSIVTVSVFNQPCKFYSNGLIERAVYNELYSGRDVNLLVLPANVEASGSVRAKQLEPSFRKVFGDDPRMAISLYGVQGFENFRLIESRNIDVVLKELELKQLGLVDDKTAIRIGKITGANFLAETSFRIVIQNERLEKTEVIKKLYSLEHGTVLGVDTVTIGRRN